MKNIGVLLIIVLALTGCKIDKNETVEGKAKIVCTTTLAGDLVKNIVGDKADVSIIMRPGVDPHEYTPRPSDTEALDGADIIVYHGLDFEGQMSSYFDNLKKNGKLLINLGEGISENKLRSIEDEFEHHHDHGDHDHDHGHYHAPGTIDPHVWNDVSIWIQCAEHVSNELSKMNPENADLFKENSAKHVEELKSLDSELSSLYASIPESSRVLVTAHDAFAYLAHRYNLKVKSLQGISTAAELGIKDVSSLAEYLIDNNIRSIFVEQSVNNKNIDAVRHHCSEKDFEVKLGGTLYSDGLGDASSGAESYLEMMRYNAKVIVNGLK